MPYIMLTFKNADINDLDPVFQEFIVELERLRSTLSITQKGKRQYKHDGETIFRSVI